MGASAGFLLILAAILLVGALGEVVFARTRIPDALWLVLVGIALGPVSGVISADELDRVTPHLGALAMIVVLFDTGQNLALSQLRSTAPRGLLLALVGFSLTMLGLALLSTGLAALGAFPHWDFAHGLMLGAILGGASAMVVVPSMTLGQADPRVARLLSVESAVTEVACVLVTLALLPIMGDTAGHHGRALWEILRGFLLATVLGVGAGVLWLPVLARLGAGHHRYPLTLGALCLLYPAVEAAGGSAPAAVLVFAIVIGNGAALAHWLGRKKAAATAQDHPADARVRSQAAFLIKLGVFTFVGLMLRPPWTSLLLGASFGLACFVLRAIAVWASLRKSGFGYAQRKLITVALPRGMAAAVLATLPARAGVAGAEPFSVLVFSALATTLLIFAVGFPVLEASARTGATPAGS